MSGESAKPDTWSKLCASALESVQQVDLPADFQIPSLPLALTRFIEASDDPDIDVRVLGKIIERDPGLTIDLLKCVNMAAFGTTQKARTPTDAIVRLGIKSAKNFLISTGLKSTTLSFKSRLMNHRNFWNESLQRALFAQSVARSIKTDSELAFMGGLLQDFMLPILTNLYDNDYLEFLRLEDSTTLHQWEIDRFGWNHAAIGASMANRWNLPEEIVCCIFFHHNMELPLQSPEKEIFELFPATLSALLPDQLTQVKDGMDRLLDADNRSQCFDLKALCETVDRDLEASCEAAARPDSLIPLMERAVQRRASNGEFESVSPRR